MCVLLLIAGCRPIDNEPTANFYVATVSHYESGAAWDHFEDGTYARWDQLTLEAESLPSRTPLLLRIFLEDGQLSSDSPFRKAGTRLRFQLDEEQVQADMLMWSALSQVELLEASAD